MPRWQKPVRARLRGQMAVLGDVVRARNPGAVSKDDQMVIPGRMFHVEKSEERMEFGFDRRGDPGKGRPALMLRPWRDLFWFALPGSWLVPRDPGHYLIRPEDWETLLQPGAPRDQFVCHWYERVMSPWLYDPLGDVKSTRFDDIRRWVKAWHNIHPVRLAALESNGSKST